MVVQVSDMTTIGDQNRMFYNSTLVSNIQMLAKKIGQDLNFNDLNNCEEEKLRDIQDNLIAKYNSKLKKDN